ncbi:MAG: FHA domain-containing protein [Planctomycetes bacterium]|nr:FHA domain-containing protein [Planctomycetota bacterium]
MNDPRTEQKWTPPQLRVDWGDQLSVGRQACPQFFLSAPADFFGEPLIDITIASQLDFEPSACQPRVSQEEKNLWTFDVPFAMTTNGDDCRPGRYRIELRAAFPHAAAGCPWYFCCTFRFIVGEAGESDGPTLEIEGDGQSIVNLHGGQLQRFKTIRLKGDGRAVVNVQDFAKPAAAATAETTEADVTICEYQLRVDEHRQRLLPTVSPAARKREAAQRMTLLFADGRRVLLFSRQTITLGRARGNDIVTRCLPRNQEHDARSKELSRQHLKLHLSEEGVSVIDRDSSQGTSFNQQRLQESLLLTAEDADRDIPLSLACDLGPRRALRFELRLCSRKSMRTDHHAVDDDRTVRARRSQGRTGSRLGIDRIRLARLPVGCRRLKRATSTAGTGLSTKTASHWRFAAGA